VAQFNTGSQAEYKRAQELFGALRGVSYDEVRSLRDGEALVGAVRATERGMMERAQRVWLRPSTLFTGGETVRAV
jgi:sirohydrochlorin ferrochelatase